MIQVWSLQVGFYIFLFSFYHSTSAHALSCASYHALQYHNSFPPFLQNYSLVKDFKTGHSGDILCMEFIGQYQLWSACSKATIICWNTKVIVHYISLQTRFTLHKDRIMGVLRERPCTWPSVGKQDLLMDFLG